MTQTPWVFGDYAIVAAGYNYPYWDPARFDRSIDAMIATLLEAGVKHVFWVTLREVKPQYISPGAWRQIQPYYWYFPTVNDHLETALARHPDLSLDRLGGGRRPARPHLRRDPPQHPGRRALQRDRAAGGDRRHNRRAGGFGHADRDSRRSRRRGGGAQPHHRRPARARLPDRLRLRPPAPDGRATTTTRAT